MGATSVCDREPWSRRAGVGRANGRPESPVRPSGRGARGGRSRPAGRRGRLEQRCARGDPGRQPLRPHPVRPSRDLRGRRGRRDPSEIVDRGIGEAVQLHDQRRAHPTTRAGGRHARDIRKDRRSSPAGLARHRPHREAVRPGQSILMGRRSRARQVRPREVGGTRAHPRPLRLPGCAAAARPQGDSGAVVDPHRAAGCRRDVHRPCELHARLEIRTRGVGHPERLREDHLPRLRECHDVALPVPARGREAEDRPPASGAAAGRGLLQRG